MPNHWPKEHQEQGDGGQILPVCECWDLEGCDDADSQSHGDQIDDLGDKIRQDDVTEAHLTVISVMDLLY